MNAYPNPFKNQFSLTFPLSFDEEISVHCTDALGRGVPVKVEVLPEINGKATFLVRLPSPEAALTGGVMFVSVYRDGRKLGEVTLIHTQ